MRYYIDKKLKEINSLIEDETLKLEDTEGAAIRYARQGAKIRQERWAEIDSLKRNLHNKVCAFKLLEEVLRKHFVLRNSDKEKDFYLDKIRKGVLTPLELTENYEGCVLVRDFLKSL